MNKRIDKFLLGLLWLLATTLGANFWFGTRFGFNIFMVSHWQYLGQLQASNEQIDSLFYISMVIIAFFMFFGFFMLVRTRLRKIKFTEQIVNKTNIIEPVNIESYEQKNSLLPSRPPRLSINKSSEYKPIQQPVNSNIPSNSIEPVLKLPETPTNQHIPYIPTTVQTPIIDNSKIEEIFKNNGYLVKNPPKMGLIRPNLFAIGTGEVLWVGSIDTEPQKLIEAVERLKSIFTETLEDIDIHIKPFIITDIDIAGYDLRVFKSLQELGDYISNNKNPEVKDSEKEDFEAYSEYIDTVADYFNKL